MSSSNPDPKAGSHYEKPQMRGRPFIIGVVAFFLFMGATYAAIWGLMRHWSGAWPLGGQSVESPVAGPNWNRQAPVVQTDPAGDLERLRQLEYARLHRCQWNDSTHSSAAIPIEDAMKILADAAARGQVNSVLTPPEPADPIQLQNQKSQEVSVPQPPNP